MISRTVFRTTTLALAALVGATLYAANKPVTVDLKDADGKDVGTAKISDKGAGVQIALDLRNLSPGEHAVHIHQNAKCEGPKFTTAGGHAQPRHEKARPRKSRRPPRRRYAELHGQTRWHRQSDCRRSASKLGRGRSLGLCRRRHGPHDSRQSRRHEERPGRQCG